MACDARATCAELSAVDEGMTPDWLGLCWARCNETFECPGDGTRIDQFWQCDGEEDCVDGADERGCRYFECSDGNFVGEERECDEWPDCPDESDEAKCK